MVHPLRSMTEHFDQHSKQDPRQNLEPIEKTFHDVGIMFVALESAVFMGKDYLDKCHSITNTRDLTLTPMFDMSAKISVQTR